MSDPAAPLRETLLRQCEAAGPNPFYPKRFAAEAATDRETLYAPLNDLRVASLVELTDWIDGQGQGYRITPLGKEVLNDPLFLAQLREGKPAVTVPPTETKATGESTFQRGEAARSAFFLPGPTRVVPILIGLNLLAFAICLIVAAREGVGVMRFLGAGDPIALDKAGAVSVLGLARGEWWRLVTNTFLHYGLMHLALNMFTLYLLRRVESLWGSGRFLVLYLICGLCGSCVGVYYSPADGDKIYFLAGASGALWGVMMSEVGWLVINRTHLPPAEVRQALQNILVTLLLNVGVSMLPNVSAAAHFGGGLVGFVSALLLQVHRFGPPARRTLAGLQLALLPTFCLLGLSAAMDADHRLQPFVVREYRIRLSDRVDPIPHAFEPIEVRAEALDRQASDQRSKAEIESVLSELSTLLKQAREADDWARRSTPPDPAKPAKEKATSMLTTLVSYADSLEKRLKGDEAGDLNGFRKEYQVALGNWSRRGP